MRSNLLSRIGPGRKGTETDLPAGAAKARRGRLARLVASAGVALSVVSVAGVVASATPAMAYGYQPVPDAIYAYDSSPYLTLHAVGVQEWNCRDDNRGNYFWVNEQPNASLYDTSWNYVGEHFLDAATQLPSWNSWDGSRVVARKVASAPSPTGAIPWLLLAKVNAIGGGYFRDWTNYVQRTNTVGGQTPPVACDQNYRDLHGGYYFSTYTADYVFYSWVAG